LLTIVTGKDMSTERKNMTFNVTTLKLPLVLSRVSVYGKFWRSNVTTLPYSESG